MADSKGSKNSQETKEQDIVQEIIEEQQPKNDVDHVEVYAYLKATQGTTQDRYAKAVGFSPRSLRAYISNNRELYEQALADAEEEAQADRYDPNNMQGRELSEEDLDAFVQGMIKSATKGDATPRDRALFVEFFGLKAEDIVNLSQSKNKSLKWLIRNNLPSISQYMDTKELGLALEESPYIDRGDRDSRGNKQAFVDADINDEAFKLELMQWGLVFLSLYNNVRHPDTEYLMQAVRVAKIQRGEAVPRINKGRLKKYASAKRWKEEGSKTLSDSEIRGKLIEAGYSKAEAEEIVANKQQATVEPPDVDTEEIEQRASQYEDQLEVLLGTEDLLAKMYQGGQV
ncbi:hypothetical protein K6L05_03655 [Salinicoccus roseus]|uniref:hypothetical protein n=1 Tax=Salinicoccus roseus TaxID=45670 RepID=UPI001CA74412|nr:hypothetical protein [Salinicoccus roseus]MBY8908880.1 hypothetical protein [Salinicoccus roseus]